MRISSPLSPSPLKSRATDDRKLITTLGHPLTLHWLGLAVAAVLVLVAAYQQVVVLLATGLFLLVMAVVSRLWSWQSLRGVSCKLTLGRERVFPGEEVELTFTAANGKWLFLPWLEVEADLPYRLATGARAPSLHSRQRLRWTTSISGGQQLRWKYRLECKARGDYRLGPVRLRCGDGFGLFPREMVLRHLEPLLVYPRIVPVDKLALPLGELVGETGVPRSIYEDTSRTMGARDYQYDDSFKRIHWKASAHHGQLQAKQYESTTNLTLLLVLDAGSFSGPEDDEAFELAVTTAASLAYEASRQRSSFGLIANTEPEVNIPVASGRSQLMLLLEALARVQAPSKPPLHARLDEYRGNLRFGTTVVIVTQGLTAPMSGLLYRLHQGGYSPLLLSVGQKMPVASVLGIPIVSILSVADLSRRHEGAGW